MKLKVGFGFDVHQLKENHPFVLGGITLDHSKGAWPLRCRCFGTCHLRCFIGRSKP
jgi:hypothetical protein